MSKEKYFKKFETRDIVFIAIMCAVAMVGCAVMPLVASLLTVVFGIAQVVTSLQIGICIAIALMKVRKPGTYLIMSAFVAAFQLLMAPPMALATILIGLLTELLVYLIFKGYDSDKAVFFVASIASPLTLPINYFYNLWFGRKAMAEVASKSIGMTIGMSVLVIALSCLGAFLGMKIYRELEKSGAIKK